MGRIERGGGEDGEPVLCPLGWKYMLPVTSGMLAHETERVDDGTPAWLARRSSF